MRTSLVALSASAFLALSAAPAAAETWDARDGHGDVRAYHVDITQQCEEITVGDRVPQDRQHDITRLAVDHGTEDVVATIRLRDVIRTGRPSSYEVAVRTPDKTFMVEVYGSTAGRVEAILDKVHGVRDPEGQGCGPALEAYGRDCTGLVADIDHRANSVTVTVPRACLGDPSWVRVGAVASGLGAGGFGDGSDIRALLDVWGARDYSLTHLLPPFGPRVHSG